MVQMFVKQMTKDRDKHYFPVSLNYSVWILSGLAALIYSLYDCQVSYANAGHLGAKELQMLSNSQPSSSYCLSPCPTHLLSKGISAIESVSVERFIPFLVFFFF